MLVRITEQDRGSLQQNRRPHGTRDSVYHSACVNSGCNSYKIGHIPHIWVGLVRHRNPKQYSKLTGSSRRWRIENSLSFQSPCLQQLDRSKINMGKLTKHHQWKPGNHLPRPGRISQPEAVTVLRDQHQGRWYREDPEKRPRAREWKIRLQPWWKQEETGQ